jgi:MFS family permease
VDLFADTIELPVLPGLMRPPVGPAGPHSPATPAPLPADPPAGAERGAGRALGRVRRLFVASLVPGSRIGRRLAVIAAIDACGTGMFLTGSALYFTRVVGLSAGQVGLGLTIAGLVGFLVVIPIGMLADRLQAGRVYVALQVWRGIWYLVYCVATNFPAFAVVACCIGVADNAVPPVNLAVIGAVVPDDSRVDTTAKVRAVRNAGFGVGALVATAAIQQGSRAAFVALAVGNALSFFLGAALLRAAGVTRLSTARATATAAPRLAANGNYLSAALLCGLLTIHMSLLTVGLPLWISTHTRVPVAIIGILVAVNTAMAVVLQARFARRAAGLRGARQCMVWSGVALAGFGVVAWVLGQVTARWLAVALAFLAVILLTCGELWSAAGRWTISYDLARPEQRAQYLSTFQLGAALQSILGPWLIVQWVFPSRVGWLVFAVAIGAAGLLVPPVARRAPQHRAGKATSRPAPSLTRI